MPETLKIKVHNTTQSFIIYETPPVPKAEDIEGYGLPKKDQKFVRWIYPTDKQFDEMDEVQQDEVINYVLNKREHGHWLYINGVKTYLTGVHWFYLTFWRLDVGPPAYRVSDRDFFYMWDYCVKDENCYGMVDMENRRNGKTERANVIEYEHISKSKYHHGGIQSKTDTDAKKVFSKIVRAWKRLPAWIKPIDEGETQPKTALRFFEPGQRSAKGKRKSYIPALDSYIDFETALEEAYDGDKLHRYTMDEAGKTARFNVFARWEIVKECFVQGDRIVGKALITTTVEEMERKGGKNFKKIWDNSNLDKRDENGQTLTGLYPYFKPAWYCLEGFIDEYGNSVHDNPEKPVKGLDGRMITIGSKEYLLRKRRGKTGGSLASEKRKYPFEEEDAFGVVTASILDADVVDILKHALKKTEEVKPAIRYVRFAEIDGVIQETLVSKDTEGAIAILQQPDLGAFYSLGIDPASTDTETGADGGSKIGAVVTCGLTTNNKLSYGPIIAYSERPANKEDCYRKVGYIAKYIIQNGGKLEICGEINGGGADFRAFLCNMGLKKYMTGQPKDYGNEAAGVKEGKDWLYVNGDVLERLHGIANRFIRRYGSDFKMPSVIQSLLEYGMSNQDEASAFLLSIWNLKDFEKPVKKVVKKVSRPVWNATTGSWD